VEPDKPKREPKPSLEMIEEMAGTTGLEPEGGSYMG
jgi:hypothetical protein